jgi:uncharacterized oxidoreductase
MHMTGNTILITGGTSGIGLALAERLLAAGNEIIVCGRRENLLAELKQQHSAIHTIASDTGNPAAREQLAADVIARFPQVNTLINNAGIQRRISMKAGEAWSDTAQEIDVNLGGPVHLSALFIPHFLKR